MGIKHITSASGEDYYKYYAGSNPTITPEQRELERYIYASRSLTAAKLPNGWYAIPADDHASYISDETHAMIKPDPDAIYEHYDGVIDRSPIYFCRLMEYRAGLLIRRKMVIWNGDSGIN